MSDSGELYGVLLFLYSGPGYVMGGACSVFRDIAVYSELSDGRRHRDFLEKPKDGLN